MSSLMEMLLLVFAGGILLGMAVDFIVTFNVSSWPAQLQNIWNYVPMLGMLIFVIALIALIRKVF